MEITLTWPEVAIGAFAGMVRQLSAMRNGSGNRYGFKPMAGQEWGIHIEAACAELAVARATGRYWCGNYDQSNAADDVLGLEVKWTPKPDHRLIVRPHVPDATVVVCVTGLAPRYTVHGWLYAHEAKCEEYLTNPTEDPSRPPAYFVPLERLHSMELLHG